ncbi:hypothetical protein ACVXHB_05880 [Escherichia coli]
MDTQDEIDFLGKLNYTKRDGPAQGRPLIDTAIDASEVILALAPETNGHVAVKAWQALGRSPGANIPIRRCTKRTRRFAFAIFRRSRVNYLQPHLVWSGKRSRIL